MKMFYEIGDEEFWPFMTMKRTTTKVKIPEEDISDYDEDGILPEDAE